MTEVKSIEECDNIPDGYYVILFVFYKLMIKLYLKITYEQPQHYCMSDKIEYNTSLPTFGDHRPLWPMFGEYKFVPPQRWLHNIEVCFLRPFIDWFIKSNLF